MPNQKYLVTARKYRPQRFGELVAQDHVSDTLKNAIRLDRLAHAYLFSGPRGVGKTTAARILAKAINCTTPLDERTDGAEPCRTCDSCRSFEEGRSLNIIEIDAASNNKVEDIRELRETVRIPPQGARKKVYIIDEVHMLSNAAFNALLKTLEEPPPYVLFIFATTEPNKVLPTILSRCQRFDFRRIVVPEIVAALQEICALEGITADEASLMLIARKGDGALRDALSVFDQAVSLCGTDLEYADLSEALGVVDLDLFFEVTRHVTVADSAGMLRLVERVVRAGYDLQEFLGGLAEHLRNLLVARTMPDTSLIEATEAVRGRYAEAVRPFTEADLLRLLMLAAEAEDNVKNSSQPRLKLEMALLKMSNLAHTADLRAALAKLDRLEALAKAGKLPAEPPAPEGPTKVSEPLPPAPVQKKTVPAEPPPPAPALVELPPAPVERVPAPEEAPAAALPDEPERYDDGPPEATPLLDRDEPPTLAAEPEAPAPTAPAPQEAEPVPPQAPPVDYPSLFGTPALKKKPPQNVMSDGGPAPAPDFDDVEVATMEPPAPEAAADHGAHPLVSDWPGFVRKVKEERIHVGSLLQHTTPIDADEEGITVAVPDAFHQRLLSNQEAFLLQHLGGLINGSPGRLRFVIREAPAQAQAPETAAAFDPYAYLQRKRQETPALQALLDRFGGEPVW